jgi:hypothetical protein
VVKHAVGQQPIRRWHKGWQGVAPGETFGDIYDVLMQQVDQAVKAQVPGSVTFVWMQGEADTREAYSGFYLDSLNGLLAQLEADLGRDDVRVVIGRLSDHGSHPDWQIVREAQVTFANASPDRAWVDCDDLNSDIHYSPEGYIKLGQRFADASLKLLGR